MKKITISHMGLIIAIVIGLLTIQSCKTIEYEQLLRPYHEIQRFTVAGYGDLDSVNAVISGSDIIIYWNADVEAPTAIKPAIAVSAAASISPASGEEVAFSETTVYTVTAEDGTAKEYKLKPVINKTIPVLFSTPVRAYWAAATPISIVGEYFLSTGDIADVKVYAKRERDGFEFDLPLNLETSTATRLYVDLPILTAELDTGQHEIYVKVGDFASNSFEIRLMTPELSTIVEKIIMDKPGKELTLGDELTFTLSYKEGWEDAGKRFFTQENTSSFSILTGPLAGGNGSSRSVTKDYLTVKDGNTLTFKLAPEIFSPYVNHYIGAPIFRLIAGGQYQTSYTFNTSLGPVIRATNYVPGMNARLAEEGQQIRAGQELTINYSFNDETVRQQWLNKTAGNIGLGLVKEEDGVFTGEYATINISYQNISDNGSTLKFTLPATASNYVGYTMKSMIFSMRVPPVISLSYIRSPVAANTVIGSN